MNKTLNCIRAITVVLALMFFIIDKPIYMIIFAVIGMIASIMVSLKSKKKRLVIGEICADAGLVGAVISAYFNQDVGVAIGMVVIIASLVIVNAKENGFEENAK